MATLENPTQSSTISYLYPAENALGRQRRDPNEPLEINNTSFHPFLHQDIDLDTEGKHANRFKTSCAITEPISDDQPTTWWRADFAEGELEVEEVTVWGETYKVLMDRAYFGTEIYIGDQLCATIDTTTWTEPFKVTQTKATKRSYGNGYQVYCDAPVTGSSVKIVSTRAPKETDQYPSGLAICDVKVHTTAREPTFWNNSKDLDAYFEGWWHARPLHVNFDKPFAQTEAGKKYPSKFDQCDYVLQ